MLDHETLHGRPGDLLAFTGAGSRASWARSARTELSTTDGRHTGMTCFLGIDGGGTKTEAVLLDKAGHEIARATGGPANYHAVGQERAARSLETAIHRVLDAAGLEASAILALGLGMAGAGRPQDQATGAAGR